MHDSKNQKKQLSHIYEGAVTAPVFKKHPKYCVGDFEDFVPYIAYEDVLENKYVVKGRPFAKFNPFDNEGEETIAEYESLDNLVNDGWVLS